MTTVTARLASQDEFPVNQGVLITKVTAGGPGDQAALKEGDIIVQIDNLAYLKNSGMVLDRRDGYRIYYRLSDHREPTKRLLFDFLRQVFGDEEQLKQDTQRLKEAIATGACTVSEWKPYSALGKPRTGRSSLRETAKV